ncbi:MAG: ATP-dependent Clp protease ATP-binding subunit, partial [Candidatus Wallbacteria bacterium]|nr:ATP-dependent Clp protease ATP-binding subunit [Candidatus Wallbacteria bacterium]
SMNEIFTNRAKKILFIAQEEAAFLGKSYVGPEHIMLAVVREADEILRRILNKYNLRYNILRVEIEALSAKSKIRVAIQRDMTPSAKLVLRNAVEESMAMGSSSVDLEHLLIALLKLEEGVIAALLREISIDSPSLIQELTDKAAGAEPAKSPKERPASLLKRCAVDLTEEARQHRLDPVIGRSTELSRMIRILARRSKNNPVLIGEPGVGKTAIVEGLAQKIVDGDVPDILEKKKIMQLSISSLIAGAKFRGDFEERVKALLDEIRGAGDVVVFIDELHTLVGAGAPEGGMDAANIFKPALARSDIQLIGATTIDEYRRYIEKDLALERRFQPIMVEEPSIDETISILTGLKPCFEEFHVIRISDNAIDKAARLSARYISDRFMPDKAIDLLDESAAHLKLLTYSPPAEIRKLKRELNDAKREEESFMEEQNYEEAASLHCKCLELEQKVSTLSGNWENGRSGLVPVLESEHVAKIISEWTGIPLSRLHDEELTRMLELSTRLRQRIIGQDPAIDSIVSTIRRARANLANPCKPLGSFIFLGPTGVGKTETAAALAAALFDSEEALIRIDMSELMEKHAVSRLIGAPPGYIGFEKGGQLTELVRRKPYSVILFDEIEKAHPDVFNILLQILENGRLTSAQGKVVNFKNTTVIMTSNIGTRDISERSSIGYVDCQAGNRKDLEKTIVKELKNKLNPELINRIDEIVVFNSLTIEDLGRIAINQLHEVRDRLKESGICIEFSDDIATYLAKKAHSEKYGARPLRRLVDKTICDFMAENILQGLVSSGDMVSLELDVVTEKVLIQKT